MNRYPYSFHLGALAALFSVTAAQSASGIVVLSTAPDTQVILGVPYGDLEFTNPLVGTEKVVGLPVLEWRDAGYDCPPLTFEDWTPNDPCPADCSQGGCIDGYENEIWLRQSGDTATTTTTVPGRIVSIHLHGDDNDGIAEVYVDGNLVATVDMYTSPGTDQALILVKELPPTTHTIEVRDAGQSQQPGTVSSDNDIAIMGAAVLTEYRASWSAFTSGGETFSSGDGFRLGSTVAQGLVDDALQGAGYTLYSGFWAPFAPINIEALEICPNDFASESGGAGGERLNRFGCVTSRSLPAVAGEVLTAFRVELHTMYNTSAGNPDGSALCPPNRTAPGLDQFAGETRYLGAPSEFVDESSPQNPNYIAAPLVCAPEQAAVRDWSPGGLEDTFGSDADTSRIYFYGPPVVPCSIYAIQQCLDPADVATCSDPLLIHTAQLADVWSPFDTVNVTDITKLVDKFRGSAFTPGPPPAGAPSEPRAFLRDNVVAEAGKLLNVTDITNGIDGFRGLPYKEQGPCALDGTDECGNPCDPTAGD